MRAEPILQVALLLQSALEQRLDSLLGFRPCQRGRKGVAAVEEPVVGWQRDVVDQILCRRDRAPIEGGDAASDLVDESVQLAVRKCPVGGAVPFSSIAVEVVRTENDFERATAPDQQWEAFGAAAAGDHSGPDFWLTEDRLLARSEAHVTGKDELATHTADAASDLRDADDGGLGETDERVRRERQARGPDGFGDAHRLAGHVKVSEVELRIRALEDNDTKIRAGVHSR